MSTKAPKVRKGSYFTNIQHVFFKDPPETFDQTLLVQIYFLKGTPPLEELRELVYEKIIEPEALYRFRSLIDLEDGVVTFKELGRKEIDMEYHINYGFMDGEAPSDMDELYKWIADQYSYENKMDDTKPLWRMFLLPEFADGQSIFLIFLHHAIGDGASLTLCLASLFDGQELDEKQQKNLRSQLVNRKRKNQRFYPLKNLWAIWTNLKTFGEAKDDVNPLTKVSKTRALGKAENIPLDKIKELSRNLGGEYTVHDILMTLLNLTVVEYFKSVDQRFMDEAQSKRVSALYPMNMRSPLFDVTKEGTSNGYLAAGILHLRLNYSSRIELLRDVKDELDLVRRSSFPNVVNNILSFQSFVNRFGYDKDRVRKDEMERDGQRTFLLSNNKGPTSPLYLLGCEVADLAGFSLSQTSNIFGILSYNDMILCSISLDAAAEPHVKRLAKFWNSEFEYLYSEALAAAT